MLDEMEEFRLLFINETEMQKQLKIVIFIFISIVYPILELIITLQIINIIDTMKNSEQKRIDVFIIIEVCLFLLFSLLGTVGMISECFSKIKTISILLILKSIFIILFFFIIKSYPNFSYYLVFNIITYGSFYTLIIVYKIFRKSIF